LFSIFDENGLRYSQAFPSQTFFDNKTSDFLNISAKREHLGKYNIIKQHNNELIASLTYGLVESITTKYLLNDKAGNTLMVGKYFTAYNRIFSGKEKSFGIFNDQGLMIAYAIINNNFLDTKSSIRFQFGKEIVILKTNGNIFKHGGLIILPQDRQVQVQMDKFKGTINLSSKTKHNLPLFGSLIILIILTADITYVISNN